MGKRKKVQEVEEISEEDQDFEENGVNGEFEEGDFSDNLNEDDGIPPRVC